MSKYFPVKFDAVDVCDSKPLWKQLFWVSLYEWDETPYGLTIRILGFNFNFLVGAYKWENE
jgi:hypothetical protein